jgi:tetratricopeptide (TPR) repeat protein
MRSITTAMRKMAGTGRMLDPREIGELVALIEQARLSEAEQGARALLVIHPDAGMLWKILGVALLRQGKDADALPALRRTTQLMPQDGEAHANLGAALHDAGQWSDALHSLGRALALQPRDLTSMLHAASAAHALGRSREAVALLQGAIALDPRCAEAHFALGNMLFDQRKLDEASARFAAVTQLMPGFAAAQLRLAVTLRSLGRHDAAEASCRAALTIEPNSLEALSLLGELLADRGRFTEAEVLFRRTLELDPEFSFAYASIATHRKLTLDDAAWAAGAEALLAKRPAPEHEIALRYALGKYHDDIGRFPTAFEHYRRANDLAKAQGPPYEPAKLTQRVDEIIASFGADQLRGPRPGASSSNLPVFIIGMPRSGTSLAEQILASHPAVFGAGEVTFWDRAYLAQRAARRRGAADAASDADPGAGAQWMAGIAAEYLGRLTTSSGAAPRVIDKMPANFLYAGLIHTVFPAARIIHMQRHPLDTCLSIYFQNFFNRDAYATDLDHLAHYYGEYRRLTSHWRAVLPAHALLEVPYEGLIADQEGWTRRMLEFLGLPWDPKCLDFHQTERVVITASKWQVRQKISPASAGRWRNYEAYLGPLRQLLEPAGAG